MTTCLAHKASWQSACARPTRQLLAAPASNPSRRTPPKKLLLLLAGVDSMKHPRHPRRRRSRRI